MGRRTLIPLVSLLLLGWACALPAQAFRCGSKLASEGDTRGEVLANCGEPAEVEHKSILRPAIIWHRGRPLRVGDGEVEVLVEIWIYNRGPNQLMRRLRFEDGTLVKIEALGYGYR